MIFTEARFVLFLVIVIAVRFALPGNRSRKLWLLACSYAFYAAWDWRFLSLLLLSTGVDYAVGRGLRAESRADRRRRLLSISLLANLGVLGVFKYLDFFIESAAAFSAWLGLPLEAPVLRLVLPMGISFYTFQTLSYSIDVYRGQMPATDSLVDFALFVSFFPQLVAGPIVRAREFLPQLAHSVGSDRIDFRAHLSLFLIGFVKKSCIADRVAHAVDPVFADPAAYDAASQWLASFLYTLQIYCDFSGYTDMAIASAGLLGYRLTVNFDFPYLARSVRVFWRRWHISLSTWFRDYLYIPLGGNRGGGTRTALNLVSVFLLCGLWHGASWNFVAWGAFHGVFLAMERRIPIERLPRPLGWLYTLLIVNAGFVLFRSQDLGAAAEMLGNMIALRGGEGALPGAWWVLLLGLAGVHLLQRIRPIQVAAQRLPDYGFAIAYGAAVALVLPFASVGYTPFIYFQF